MDRKINNTRSLSLFEFIVAKIGPKGSRGLSTSQITMEYVITDNETEVITVEGRRIFTAILLSKWF